MALRTVYSPLMLPGDTVLDLMSSWRSHLPDGLGRVTGLGMNPAEMSDNPLLDGYVVHDLNRNPRLALERHLVRRRGLPRQRPVLVRPWVSSPTSGGSSGRGALVVSFSDRRFPTKAVAIWLLGGDVEHVMPVRSSLEAAGYGEIHAETPRSPDDPLFVDRGR